MGCYKWWCIHSLPNTVIDDDISMARSHTSAILNPVSRFVELCRDPNGFLMPKYLPKLMKHMCKMLAEQANTSHVTYTLHHVNPKGQLPVCWEIKYKKRGKVKKVQEEAIFYINMMM